MHSEHLARETQRLFCSFLGTLCVRRVSCKNSQFTQECPFFRSFIPLLAKIRLSKESTSSSPSRAHMTTGTNIVFYFHSNVNNIIHIHIIGIQLSTVATWPIHVVSSCCYSGSIGLSRPTLSLHNTERAHPVESSLSSRAAAAAAFRHPKKA
jgi:hypothetical protein